jgi:hypothetical protein
MVETKDIQRLQDIKAQPGKEFGLASKQAKLIKDSAKAYRRYRASEMVFGGSHTVTNIFYRRYRELCGDIVTPTATATTVVEVKEKPVKPVKVKVEEPIQESRITRFQKDFPIGCGAKQGEERGTVIDHDSENEEIVYVDFGNGTEAKSIYDIKRC